MRHDKALKFFLATKHHAELFSKDPSTQVGAYFLHPETYDIMSSGYNGMPRKIDESRAERWERPRKYLLVEHAERNAIYNAMNKGVQLRGSIAIVTMHPCADCARALIAVEVSKVVCPKPTEDLIERWGGHFQASQEMLMEAGVDVMYVNDLSTEGLPFGLAERVREYIKA